MRREEFKKEGETVPAADLVTAMQANRDINVVKCIIEGDAFLGSVIVEGRVTIRDTIFKDNVDWSYSVLKRSVRLERAIFEKEVNFNSTSFEGSLSLEAASLEGHTNFTRIHIGARQHSETLASSRRLTSMVHS
jgi:hypothetical protein